MSTRGSTFWDDPSEQDWVPTARPWCPECCVPSCGCPTGEALLTPPTIIRGTD